MQQTFGYVKSTFKNFGFVFGLAMLLLVCLACASENPRASGEGESPVGARNVKFAILVDGGSVNASGDSLEIGDNGNQLVLKGNASIIIEGDSKLNAKADRIEIEQGKQLINMDGNVKAVFPGPKVEGIDADGGG